jgi:hypothetical protein
MREKQPIKLPDHSILDTKEGIIRAIPRPIVARTDKDGRRWIDMDSLIDNEDDEYTVQKQPEVKEKWEQMMADIEAGDKARGYLGKRGGRPRKAVVYTKLENTF